MNIFSKFTAMVILAGALSSPAMASGFEFESEEFECEAGPRSEWMSKDDILKSLTDQGYKVRKVEMEEGCYEVYAMKDGKKYEVYVNPTTGAIVKTEKK